LPLGAENDWPPQQFTEPVVESEQQKLSPQHIGPRVAKPSAMRELKIINFECLIIVFKVLKYNINRNHLIK
jgi:hypothetical protein